MMTLIALCAGLAAAQDPESRYREALYHEVDKGDLDRALELYAKLEAEAGAPEPVRARAAFRRAWCLEKKGAKAQAESAYRSVAARFPDQAEIVAKARERLDRLSAVVERTGGPASQDDRIAELILALGSHTRGDQAPAELRSLVLIGDPAVPALRKALTHRDVTLSTRAAQALVQLGQDEGTYDPLFRGLGQGVPGSEVTEFTTLLSKKPDARKAFIESFLKEEEAGVLQNLVAVPRAFELPELRPRLLELMVRGKGESLYNLTKIAEALHLSREEELLDLLAKLEKADLGAVRAQAVFSAQNLRVTDTRTFCKHVLALFPKWEDLGRSSGNLPKFVPLHVLLRECGATWIKSDTDGEGALSGLVDLIRQLDAEHNSVIAHLLRQGLKDQEAAGLIEILSYRSGDPTRLDALEVLWWAAEHLGPRAKGEALKALLPRIPEAHPRWEELIGWALRHPSENPARLLAPGIFRNSNEPWSLFATQGEYDRYSAGGKKRIQTLANQLLLEGSGIEQAMAFGFLRKFPDPARFEAFSTVALDESRDETLRQVAVQSMQRADLPTAIRKRLVPLLGDKNVPIRTAAIFVMVQRRDGETDKLLLPMIEDPEQTVAFKAVEYFTNAPRKDFLEPFTRALKSKDSTIRKAGAGALGRTESIQAVPELIGALEDEDLMVRQEVRKSLEQIKKRYDEVDEWKRWSESLKKKNP